MTKILYELWHLKIGAKVPFDVVDPTHDPKQIGSYTTVEKALAARNRVKDKLGFCDWPEGFRILQVPVDVDFWTLPDASPNTGCAALRP